MELLQYWQIIRRRWWILLVLPLLVLAVSLLARPPRAATYVASMRFMIGLEPEAKTGDYYAYDKYYTWLTAEYLVDDVSELVRSQAFARAVSEHLSGSGLSVPPGSIQGSTQAGRLHRILTVTIAGSDHQQITAIANAVAALLPGEVARHLAQVGTQNVSASLIDPPAVGAIGPGLRDRLDLPIRVLLAVVAALALVLLLDYLDNTVRDRAELEQSGVPVLAEIPATRSRFGLPVRRT